MRRLVEHVAAIATAYPDDIVPGSELYGRLQTVVRAVEVVAHAFQVRSQVLSEQVKIEYQRAVYGMGQLVAKVGRERRELESNAGRRNRRDYRRRPSREREFEISGKIEKLLAERLRDREVPESVAEFLKGVWLRHLRTAVLRDGEESAGYQAALKVVDDLLWTIDGEGQRRSRSELAQRIPGDAEDPDPGDQRHRREAGRLPAVLRRDVPDPPAADAEAAQVGRRQRR